MKIVEIFDSIQGEGSFIGRPCTFIRTSGCNLSCPWCDTKESWNDSSAKEMTIKEIADQVQQKIVVITGGEPLIQTDLKALIAYLTAIDKMICIETNGTLAMPCVGFVHITCSPKPQNNYKIHSGLYQDELKYVVDAEFDDVIAIPEFVRMAHAGRIWLQPEGSNMQENWKKCYEIAMSDPRLRVGLQLHKLMEVK